MMASRFYVYVMFHPMTGVPCYVGKGTGDRIKRLRRDYNKRLMKLINTFGALPSVIVRDGLTNEAACETEIALISAIGRGKRGPLYNQTDGGDGSAGYKWPAASKAKLNEFWSSDAGQVERNARSLRGKELMSDPSQRAAVSARSIGNRYGAGHKMAEDHRKKLGAAAAESNRRREFDTEARAERSARAKAMWADPDFRARLSANRRIAA